MSDNPAQVLLVDDDALVLKVCADALRHAGYAVTPVGTGQGALQAFAEQPFAAAVVDLVLPDVDGLTLLGAMREADPDIVVILMTGYASVESAIEAVRRGAYDYLRKPFTADDLSRVMKRGLSQRQLAVENRQLMRDLDVMNQELSERVRVATEELHAFISLGRRLDEAEGPLPLLSDLTVAATQLAGATTGAIFLGHADGRFECLVAEGEAAAALRAGSPGALAFAGRQRSIWQDPLFDECAASDKPVIRQQLLASPDTANGPLALLGLSSAMVIPLNAVSGTVGVLGLFDGEGFTERQASLVKVLAAQAAEVILLTRRLMRPAGETEDGFVDLQDVLGAQ
ncbi:MAG: response regulator [Armatimonadia bacterium]